MSTTKATLYSKFVELSEREKEVASKRISSFLHSLEPTEDPEQAFLKVLGRTLDEGELNIVQQVLTSVQKGIGFVLVLLSLLLIHSLI